MKNDKLVKVKLPEEKNIRDSEKIIFESTKRHPPSASDPRRRYRNNIKRTAEILRVSEHKQFQLLKVNQVHGTLQ